MMQVRQHIRMDDGNLRDQILRLEANRRAHRSHRELSEGYSSFKGLLTVAHRLHANELIDFVVIPFYGAAPSADSVGFFAFRSEATWLGKTQNDVNGPKQTFAN